MKRKLPLLTLPLLFLCPLASAQAAALPETVQQALYAALDDEYRAEAVYAGVITKIGSIKPFSNIINAERQHQVELANVMKANGLAVSANPYIGGTKPLPQIPASRAEACRLGVQAEEANVTLYNDKLIPAARDYPAVLRVFTALRDASFNKHLPAFRRCAGR